MIHVSVAAERDHIAVEIQGHAEYSEPGQDIVCAAVSSLSLALHSWAITHEAAFCSERSQGHSFLSMESTPESKTALEMFLCGLRSIESDYGEYVSLEEK